MCVSSNGKMSHMHISPKADPATINHTFGEQVRKFRTERGLKQAELAEKMSQILGKPVNVSTMNRIENGARPTPLSEVYALSEALRVSVHNLIPPEDKLAQITLPIFNAAQDARKRIIQLERELEELRKTERRLDGVILQYWTLRGVRGAEAGDGDWDQSVSETEFQKAIASISYHIYLETGDRDLTEIAEAMQLPEEKQREVYNAENEGSDQALIVLLNVLTDHYRDRLNASS